MLYLIGCTELVVCDNVRFWDNIEVWKLLPPESKSSVKPTLKYAYKLEDEFYYWRNQCWHTFNK